MTEDIKQRLSDVLTSRSCPDQGIRLDDPYDPFHALKSLDQLQSPSLIEQFKHLISRMRLRVIRNLLPQLGPEFSFLSKTIVELYPILQTFC